MSPKKHKPPPKKKVPWKKSKGVHPFYAKAPANVNWDKAAVIGPVKHQGRHRSCVAHALCKISVATYAIQYPKKPLLDLAEQHLVDCSIDSRSDPKGRDCQDSTFQKGYRFIKNCGIYQTGDYGKYTGQRCFCKTKKDLGKCWKLRISGFEWVDKKKVRDALENGPLTAAIVYTKELYEFEGEDIYEPPAHVKRNWTFEEIDDPDLHAVVVLEFGIDENGKEFYLIENSWGEKFGYKGRARVAADCLYFFCHPVGASLVYE